VDPERDARDRGEGRRLVCVACRAEGGPVRAEALARLEPDEAAAVVALDAVLVVDAASAGDRAWTTSLVRAALAAGAGPELTRALGAMARGARGEDHGCPWERAGRELALVHRRIADQEVSCRG
jgi:hypothetical protein